MHNNIVNYLPLTNSSWKQSIGDCTCIHILFILASFILSNYVVWPQNQSILFWPLTPGTLLFKSDQASIAYQYNCNEANSDWWIKLKFFKQYKEYKILPNLFFLINMLKLNSIFYILFLLSFVHNFERSTRISCGMEGNVFLEGQILIWNMHIRMELNLLGGIHFNLIKFFMLLFTGFCTVWAWYKSSWGINITSLMIFLGANVGLE